MVAGLRLDTAAALGVQDSVLERQAQTIMCSDLGVDVQGVSRKYPEVIWQVGNRYEQHFD
jgi:hypothetical protein